MKLWKVVLFSLAVGVVSAAITDARQEQPAAGDKRGNRCFNGRYWKECGTPDVPVAPPAPVVAGGWQTAECYTNDCIRDTLNSLPFERAAEAKLTTWKNYTYVWFRR